MDGIEGRGTVAVVDRPFPGGDDASDPVRSSPPAEDSATTAHDVAGSPSAEGLSPSGLRSDIRAFVLVVDDERDVRDSIASVLQASGFAVASAVDGTEAYRVLEELFVDVMVLDIRMPKLDGPSLIESLADPPAAVIVSANTIDAHTRARLDGKVSAYLQKPFDPRDLVAAVERASRGR